METLYFTLSQYPFFAAILNFPFFRLIAALLVFLLFWSCKKKLSSLLSRLLHRLLNRKSEWLTKAELEQIMVPGRSLMVLIGAYCSASILGWAAYPLFVHCFRILAIALLAWLLLRFWDASADLLLDANRYMKQQLNLNLNKTLMSVLRMVVKVLIIAFAVLAILEETGTDVTALITGLGLGGLTFALAAQDMAANLFAGMVILLDHPFAVDDYIETPDVVGTVEEITFRSTRLRTLTNAQVIVPNNVLTSKPITNWSRLQKRRVAFTIRMKYDTGSAQLQRCIQRISDMLNSSEEVVEDSTCVNFDAFADSSLNINILYFTKEVVLTKHLKIKEKLNLQILSIIEDEGCSFAFPTQTLHVQQDTTAKASDEHRKA